MDKPAAVQESTEMLPCPFCGSSETRWVADLWFIACHNKKCAATGPTHKTREAAIAAWNTRTPAASPVAGVSARTLDVDRAAALSDNEAKDARIAELQRTVNAVAGGAAQGLMLHAKLNNAFSAGGQRVRRSVEALLEEKWDWSIPAVREMVRARIREAVKGDK